MADAIRHIGVKEITYYRWRKEFGGLQTNQVRRIKDLEQENARLRRAVSDLTINETLTYRFTGEDRGKKIRRYWTTACSTCPLKSHCTTGPERRISRWEHEAVLEKVQARLDHNLGAMALRRSTAEHPFGTIKCNRPACTALHAHTNPAISVHLALSGHLTDGITITSSTSAMER